MNLRKIDNFRWEIPQSGKMKTSGLIFSSEKMIDHVIREKAAQQVANVASLPGIVGKAMAMPDIHWGYGFPIGGVAAFDINKGIISPGGIGYDINCLSENSEIMHELGYKLKIKDFENNWKNEEIKSMDLKNDEEVNTKIKRYFKKIPENKIYEIKTELGYKLTITEDHPLYTKDGMKKINKFKELENVAIVPFEGIKYERAESKTIINEQTIRKKLNELEKESVGNADKQIIKELKKRKLLPLKSDSEQFQYILKIMGYVTGDGNIYFVNKRKKGVTGFWGKERDLLKIRSDIKKIGYNCSKIYKRKRKHSINTNYGKYAFKTTETSCKVVSSSFAILLSALGTPIGKKTNQEYRIPHFINGLKKWQKRLYLASFFGAEMSSPCTITGHKYNLMAPVISINKEKCYVKSGSKFIDDIEGLLNEFGIKTTKTVISKEFSGENKKEIVRLRMCISGKTDNLINLYSRIGFEYNQRRQYLANAALLYLKNKEKHVNKRLEIDKYVEKLCNKYKGMGISKIYKMVPNSYKQYVNMRFVERSMYEGRKTLPRVSWNTQNFEEFVRERTAGLKKSGMLWDKIISIKKVNYKKYVYDFTVENKYHNFIANNFVVSNCGVRLLRTNLKYSEIERKIRNIIPSLFTNITSGVGSTGRINLSKSEVKDVLEKGSKFAVQRGYGSHDDLKHTEEEGCLPQADSSVISNRALERGSQQLGTLGAGNHFLEVQKVDDIYDEQAANVFGLYKDQFTIMIHTGSRGLGYQVCDDYLRVLQEASRKYQIELLDRQLACAPINSDEGKRYFAAMCAAANYAWANRQIITHWVRDTIIKTLGISPKELGLEVVYDVAHNIGKIEEHGNRKLLVHRKGATRAFPAGRNEIPEDYRQTGQPVLVPGTMGTESYVLVGTRNALNETWGSTCHGAGRMMSRSQALKGMRGQELAQKLKENGIMVQADSWKTLAEEAPSAYKNVSEVVNICHDADISKKVARLKPKGVIKG